MNRSLYLEHDGKVLLVDLIGNGPQAAEVQWTTEVQWACVKKKTVPPEGNTVS